MSAASSGLPAISKKGDRSSGPTRLRSIRDVRLRLVEAAPALPAPQRPASRVLAELPKPPGTITLSMGRWWIATDSGFLPYDPAITGGN